jgi:hypothetical protein
MRSTNFCYKRATVIPGAQLTPVAFCTGNMGWISRETTQMHGQGHLFQNGAQEAPSHHSTLRSTDGNSDKADSVCPQDFRTKHFYFPQKRATEQLLPLASKLRNFWPLKFMLKNNSNYLSGRNRLNISYIYTHVHRIFEENSVNLYE